MPPSLHSVLGASSAHRWLACTPSARLSEKLDKRYGRKESAFAAEGTKAHELGEIKKRLLPYMEKALGSHGESMLFFMLTDIIHEKTELLCYGGDSLKLAQEAFHRKPEDGSFILPGVVSRKKQLIPAFMNALQQ